MRGKGTALPRFGQAGLRSNTGVVFSGEQPHRPEGGLVRHLLR